MSRPAILVEDLSKAYRLGLESRGFPTFRETIVNAFASPLRRLRRLNGDGSGPGSFWALRHVNFDIAQGEVVGIIGHNGAGKSTLLKVLSRITEPTEGSVRLRGRVASLLEVGTGFHPELTGRENVTLSGSILGMKKSEIDAKFDRIVEFAEVSKFLDTPVKHYSSGMYVRLAFSVAAHLDPGVLIVDEVLAVGDANYQRRCIDRMSELAGSGATILFVSHNMDLIPRLCDRAIILKAGQVQSIGPAAEMTRQYMEGQATDLAGGDLRTRYHSGSGEARFVRYRLVDAEGRPQAAHRSGEDFIVEVEIESSTDLGEVDLTMSLRSVMGMKVVTGWSKEVDFTVRIRPGLQAYRCHFRNVHLRPGHRVIVGLWMASMDVIDWVENAAIVDIIDGEGSDAWSNRSDQGLVLCPFEWSHASCWGEGVSS